MKVNVIKHRRKLADWALLIEQQQSSGLTVRQWCSENSVAVSSFYQWQNRLCKALAVAQTPTVPSIVPSFVDVTSVANNVASKPAIDVSYNGFSVSIASGTDPATIQAVIWALQKSC